MAAARGTGRVEPPDDLEGRAGYQAEVAALQAEVTSLRMKLEFLERENQMLLTRVSGCPQCSKPVVLSGKMLQEGNKSVESCVDRAGKPLRDFTSEKPITDPTKGLQDESREQKLAERLIGCCLGSTNNHPKRYVALRIVYLGQRFYGFSSEAQKEPTVESEVFKALEKTKLSVADKQRISYSRCGRTDKGVSSTGQVISLYLRSKVASGNNTGSEQDIHDQEIDYVKVLNKALPEDIRITGWSYVSPEFHARFSCLYREYKYLFWRGSLDLMAMKTAAQKFIGVHDFRNFCKMDAANVKNYTRKIISFEISPCVKICNDDEIWAMTIKGSAFLWHQVRCMVAVLFMVGEGHESPSVIDLLLDTTKVPRKPQYNMASELPLILRNCEFEDLKFVCTSDARQAISDELKAIHRRYLLQAAIVHEALDFPSAAAIHKSLLETCKKKRSYIPLMMRPTEPSYEERCARLDKKVERRVKTL